MTLASGKVEGRKNSAKNKSTTRLDTSAAPYVLQPAALMRGNE
jgi:hypothetical protein